MLIIQISRNSMIYWRKLAHIVNLIELCQVHPIIQIVNLKSFKICHIKIIDDKISEIYAAICRILLASTGFIKNLHFWQKHSWHVCRGVPEPFRRLLLYNLIGNCNILGCLWQLLCFAFFVIIFALPRNFIASLPQTRRRQNHLIYQSRITVFRTKV